MGEREDEIARWVLQDGAELQETGGCHQRSREQAEEGDWEEESRDRRPERQNPIAEQQGGSHGRGFESGRRGSWEDQIGARIPPQHGEGQVCGVEGCRQIAEEHGGDTGAEKPAKGHRRPQTRERGAAGRRETVENQGGRSQDWDWQPAGLGQQEVHPGGARHQHRAFQQLF